MAKKPEQKPQVDRDLIHQLAALLTETGLTEIEIERAGLRVRVARGRVLYSRGFMPPAILLSRSTPSQRA